MSMTGWAFDLPLVLWIPEQEEQELRHRKHLDMFGGPTGVQKAGYLGANIEEGEDFSVWGSKRDGLCREMGTTKASRPLPFFLSDGR